MGNGHTSHSQAGEHDTPGLSPYAVRAHALEALLEEKGILSTDEVQQEVARIDARSPADGARVVARAWLDSVFRKRLLSDPRSALLEMGYSLPDDPGLIILENTDTLHHLVVCTLCSCYPRNLLGRLPDWYKSLAYRSRAVTDPGGVIREFGLELEEDVDVRVVDSNADLRYMVLPRRPPGTDGLSEEELAQLVTRDSLIGVARPRGV